MNRRSQIGLLVVLLTIGTLGTSCPSDVIPLTYTLTVNYGTGSGSYAVGSVATITAASPSGYVFDEWTGDVSTVADVTAATTAITMDANRTVTATFTELAFTPFQDSTGGQLYFDNVQMVAAGVGYAVTSTAFPSSLTFYQTTDNGATWAELGTIDTGNTSIGASYAVAFHPDILAYSTYFSGFGFEGTAGVSLNDGASWSHVEDAIQEQYGGYNTPFGSAAVFGDTFWQVVGEQRDSLASLAISSFGSAAEWDRNDLSVQDAIILSTQGTSDDVGNFYMWANETSSSDDWELYVLTASGWAALRSSLGGDFWLTNWTMQRNTNAVTLIDAEDTHTSERGAIYCDPANGTYQTIYYHDTGGDSNGYYLTRAIATETAVYVCLLNANASEDKVVIQQAVNGEYETVIAEDDASVYYYFQTDYNGRVYALRRGTYTTGFYELDSGQ